MTHSWWAYSSPDTISNRKYQNTGTLRLIRKLTAISEKMSSFLPFFILFTRTGQTGDKSTQCVLWHSVITKSELQRRTAVPCDCQQILQIAQENEYEVALSHKGMSVEICTFRWQLETLWHQNSLRRTDFFSSKFLCFKKVKIFSSDIETLARFYHTPWYDTISS